MAEPIPLHGTSLRGGMSARLPEQVRRRGGRVVALTGVDAEQLFQVMAMLEGRRALEVTQRATADDLAQWPPAAPAAPQASASPVRSERRLSVQADLRIDPHTSPHIGQLTGQHTGPHPRAAAGVVAQARRGTKAGVEAAGPVRPANTGHLIPLTQCAARNAQANLSAKGLKQAAGLMVNYFYDLSRIETSHDRFVQGRVVHSRALSALL